MKANRTYVEKETTRTKYVFLPVVSDVHPGHDLMPHVRHFYYKNTKIDGVPKLTLIFDIPGYHKMSLHSNRVCVKLQNLTTNLPIPVSDNERQEIVLDPNSHYKITIKIESKSKNASPKYTKIVTYDFKPEK